MSIENPAAMVFVVGIAAQQIHMHVYFNLGGGNTPFILSSMLSVKQAT